MKNVTIKQLRSFVTIAREHSFTRAAGRMNVSQSTLTIAIRDLEAEIGSALFDRTTRSVELTVQGERFLPVAHRMLEDLTLGIKDLRALENLRQGHVVVIGTPAVISVAVVPALRVMARSHAGITVRIIEDSTERLAARLLNGEADFGISTLRRSVKDLDQRLLLKDRLGVLCPRDHPLAAKRGDLTWADLAKYPVGMIGPEAGIRAMVDNDPRIGQSFPQPKYEVSSVASLLALVEGGVSIGVFPGIASCPAISRDLVFRPVLKPVLQRELYFLKRQRQRLTPAARELAGCVFEQFSLLQAEQGLGRYAEISQLTAIADEVRA